ncbi:hypothetical protein KI387_018238, partial [Taxus chinensis]
ALRYATQEFRPIGEQRAIWNSGQLGQNYAKDAVRANRPKMEQFARLTLGHLGHERVVRVNRPKMEQKAHLNLGHLRQKVPEYAARLVRAKMEQLALFDLGHLEQESAKYVVQ